MTLLLAIETSARIGSVALQRWDATTTGASSSGELLGVKELGAELRHDAQLLSAIDELLGEFNYNATDLSAVAFGEGPGSFTGVRLAASAAQGIGWGAGIPVIGVNSMAALAAGIRRKANFSIPTAIAVAIDARMGQIYWLWCDGSTPGSSTVLSEQQLAARPPPGQPFVGAGDGWKSALLPAPWRVLAGSIIPDAVAHAADVAALARLAFLTGARPAAGEAQPQYLHGADAWQRR